MRLVLQRGPIRKPWLLKEALAVEGLNFLGKLLTLVRCTFD